MVFVQCFADKWVNDDNSFIATYPFTSPATDVTINNYVLHALTDRGIETYTLRTGHRLFNNYFEYNLREDSSFCPIEVCPRLEDPICLIGLRPFLGLQRMHCTNKSLVLLASSLSSSSLSANVATYQSSDKENSTLSTEPNWTIYCLKLPSPEQLYYDFEDVAKQHQKESNSTYMHLMSEAHIIIRIANEFLNINRNGKFSTVRPYESDACMNIFLESCQRLGDLCVLSIAREDYCQAFPYYIMGRLCITDVYDRVQNLINATDHYCNLNIGLIHTLKNMLIKLRHGSEEMCRLLTTVRSGKNITFGEELLDLFLVNAPHEIAVLTLRSQFFRDCMSSKVCEVVNTKHEM